jgi:methionyl-tRNA formyltransferase
MSAPRILVFAYSDLGHACLKLLMDRKEDICGVITHADHPDENIWFPSVKNLAEKRGLSVFKDPDLKNPNDVAYLKHMNPDLIFSFYFRSLIPVEILAVPKLGAFNMHGSFLPKYRGRAPINWAVLNGETRTGATLHVMEAKADAGDIVDQEAVPIGLDDTALEVQTRVTQAAVEVLSRQIDALKEGRAPRKRQIESEATTFGRRTAADGAIDWSKTAREIHNLVRAVTHPFPGAFGNIRGIKTTVWKTRLTDRPRAQLKPGDVVIENGQLFVACGDRCLEILRLQTDGQTEIDGANYK